MLYIKYESSGPCSFRQEDFWKLHFENLVFDHYLGSLNSEIEQSVDVEANTFWKLVNARRKRNRSHLTSGMNFDGTTVRDCDSITDGWFNYFQQLYTPCDVDGDHDDVWERHVNENLDVLMNDIKPDSRACVLPSEIEDIISKCPKGKAGGHDGL